VSNDELGGRRQLPVASCQLPVARRTIPDPGPWELETGNWKLEADSWKLICIISVVGLVRTASHEISLAEHLSTPYEATD
jgi:hypothetical protein